MRLALAYEESLNLAECLRIADRCTCKNRHFGFDLRKRAVAVEATRAMWSGKGVELPLDFCSLP